MALPPLSPQDGSPARRPPTLSLGMRLGVTLVGVVFLALIDLLVLEQIQTSRLGLVEIVNEVGKLRYLSQSILHHGAHAAGKREEARTEITALVQEGNRRLAWIHDRLAGFDSFDESENREIRQYWETLRQQWLLFQKHGQELTSVLSAGGEDPRQLKELHDDAQVILGGADRLARTIDQAEKRFVSENNLFVYAILSLELLLAAWLAYQFIRRVRLPLREFSRVVEAFAAGDYATRIRLNGLKGEVRDLAEVMNTTAETIQELITHHQRHLRQTTLLHHVAQLLRPSARPIPEVLSVLAGTLSLGWRCPDATHVRIRAGKECFASPLWRDDLPGGEQASLMGRDGQPVMVELRFERAECESADKGERDLLLSVVEMIRGYMEHHRESALRDLLSSIVESTSDFACSATPDGRAIYLNRALRQAAGISWDEPTTRHSVADFHPPWAMAAVLKEALPTAAREGIWSGESAVLDREGWEIPVSMVVVAHRTTDGMIDYFSTLMRDISLHKRMERELTAARDHYLRLFEDFPNPIWRAGTDGGCDYFNTAWLALTGRTLEEERGDGWSHGVHPEDLEHCLAVYRHALEHRVCFRMEYRLRNANGEYRWLLDHGSPFHHPDGTFGGYIGSCFDLTERKRYEQQLEYQANHDELTGLPNGNLLNDRLAQALAYAHRQASLAAVMFVDLDRFKTINDSLGHGEGDRLLQAVGRRLSDSLRECDTVARRGGDEFVLVVSALDSEEDAATVAHKVFQDLAAPFVFDGREVFITCSLGIALHPRDGEDVETLIRNADAALYRAKEMGRNTFSFYTNDLNERAREHLALEQELRQALEREEFLLYYQPQIHLATGLLSGMEALIRWQHPRRGVVSPGEFIPLAEENGLIVPMGTWVLNAACAQLAAWRDKGLPMFRVAVNVSARQFRLENLAVQVRDALERYRLQGEWLEIEMTETLLVSNPEQAAGVLEEIRQLGVEVALDDFGIGYSSLGYLRRFPLNKIKIDQSFVRQVASDVESAAIVRTIIDLAHNLKLRTLAEGVETEEQRGFLRQNHCDEVQGFLFSKPLPATAMEALLRSGAPLADGELVDAFPRTLLLLDDEETLLASLTRVLRREGYRVLATTDPDEAMNLLARHRVGVVVSDQRMPRVTGVEFLRRVKEIHPETVRIILSGHADVKSLTDAINDGAIYKFLSKPCEVPKLKSALEEAFRVHETALELHTPPQAPVPEEPADI